MGASASGARDPEEALDMDGVLDVLANERRRLVIEVLAEEGMMTWEDLPREVANRQAGGSATELERKRVHVSLYQSHIPRLKDRGVVEAHETGETEALTGGPAFGLVHRVHRAVERAMEREGHGLMRRFLG